ncbi:hypothetical protein U1Q18_026018, partial [Sarracenia purpurea var. burkii]
ARLWLWIFLYPTRQLGGNSVLTRWLLHRTTVFSAAALLGIDFCRSNQSRVSRRLSTPLIVRDSQNPVAARRHRPASRSCGLFSSFPVTACSAPPLLHTGAAHFLLLLVRRRPLTCAPLASVDLSGSATALPPPLLPAVVTLVRICGSLRLRRHLWPRRHIAPACFSIAGYSSLLALVCFLRTAAHLRRVFRRASQTSRACAGSPLSVVERRLHSRRASPLDLFFFFSQTLTVTHSAEPPLFRPNPSHLFQPTHLSNHIFWAQPYFK